MGLGTAIALCFKALFKGKTKKSSSKGDPTPARADGVGSVQMGMTKNRTEETKKEIEQPEYAKGTSIISEKFASIVIQQSDMMTRGGKQSTKKKSQQLQKIISEEEEEEEGEEEEGEEEPARLQNIYAIPVNTDEDYVRPVFPKSDSEKAVLYKVFETNFVFMSLEMEDKDNVIDAFEKINVSKGRTIITEGEVGDYLYVIEKGNVDFSIAGSKVGSADEGESFGDLALIYNCPRAATCVARDKCSLWRLDQVTYRKVVANNARANENVKRNLLRKVPFLDSVDEADLNKMASAATTVKILKGQSIVHKGEIGKDFYLVLNGKVTIKDIEAGGKKFEDQTLGPGEYFGERAIVRHEPRAANVIALDNVALLSISQEVFMKVVGPLKDLVIKANDLRRLKGIPAFANSDITESEYRTLVSLVKDRSVETGVTLVEETSKISGAIHIIRSGVVKLTSSAQDGASKTITEGGYFGEQSMHMKLYESRLSAVTQQKTDIGTITYQDIKSVIHDMSRLSTSSSSKTTSIDKSITLNNLKKHRILGVGTFGKVWLVSHVKNKKSSVYALKVQEKRQLLKCRQVEGVKREAKVMARINHPFIIKMVSLYQTTDSIMMLLQLVPGGELYSIMKKARRRRVPEEDTKFYTSGILEGLSHIHRRDIVHRDLKPENVLINSDGYVVLVDMGFAKVVKDKTFTLCGTPWYIAPEVIVGKGHDKGCDYWSWAILVHEMLSGVTPFHAYGQFDQMTLFKAIVQGKSKIRSNIGDDAKDLIEKILVNKSSLRLGCLAGGDRDIKKHKWLKDIDFHKLVDRKIDAPWKPAYKDPLDCSEFNNWDHVKTEKKEAALTKKEQEQFKGFNDIL